MKLEVKNLIKKFNSTIAVNNISFEIEKNKTLGLLGPNGCGKTTSIGMMLGLITPTSGEVLINGISLNSNNRIELLSLMNFASPYIELLLNKILRYTQGYMVSKTSKKELVK